MDKTSTPFSVAAVVLVPALFLLLVVTVVWRLQAGTEAATSWAQHSTDVIEQVHRLQADLHAPAAAADRARLQSLVRDNPAQEALAKRLAGPADFARFEQVEDGLRDARRAAAQRLWNAWSVALVVALLGAAATLAIGTVFVARLVLRLRRSNDALVRYRLLAENARDAIFFIRRSDGQILDANRAAVETYGYSREALLGMTAYELRTPEAAALADKEIPRSEAFNVTVETEHRRKDGSSFPVEASMQSAEIDGDRVVLSVVRDVTQRRSAERAVAQALEQAMEASRLKSEFVATMSHEIRTPMNGVIGMTELLLDSPLSAEQRELAETARESAHALLGVINNILDFSKIEAGKVELELTEFDIVSKVESIATMIGPQAHKKQIALMSYVDPSIPPRLVGDAIRLRQVLINLVGNAVKFTAEGTVAVSADLLHRTQDMVRVHFAVRDTGIGIDAALVPHLFEPFAQADGSTTRRYGGTGLGLTISKRLVELMGGSIRVESVPQRGSTFSFDLIFRPATLANGAARRELRELNALVVDDDVLSRDILSRYASSWGVRTSVAGTGMEALAMMRDAAARNERYDLAIVDLRMPQVDGLELAKTIRADADLAPLRLILVTAFDAPGLGQRALDAGFSAYLTKPVRQSQLFDSIVDAVYAPSHLEERAGVSMPAAPHGEAILLAEDNAINRQVTQRQLEKLGYPCDVALDGKEAYDAWERGAYALILMDCQMPLMDGFQATRAIRRREAGTGQRVPIVAMTANAMAGDRDECLIAGMDDYLAKPVGLGDLQRILTRWLPQNQIVAFDRARVDDLFVDDQAAKRAFLAAAVSQLAELCRRLETAVTSDELRELAHEIKGAAGNTGAGELAEAAAAIEAAAKAGQTPGPSRRSEVMDAYRRFAREASRAMVAAEQPA